MFRHAEGGFRTAWGDRVGAHFLQPAVRGVGHMKDMRQGLEGYAPSRELHRILRTSISIFNSAMTLLGDPPEGGVVMPSPAHIECMRNLLGFLGVGDEADFYFC
jgi:hypothetical protein